MDEASLNRKVEQAFESLRREFEDEFTAGEVASVGRACFETLRADARITDFVPVLVGRYARETLLVRAGREELHRSA